MDQSDVVNAAILGLVILAGVGMLIVETIWGIG